MARPRTVRRLLVTGVVAATASAGLLTSVAQASTATGHAGAAPAATGHLMRVHGSKKARASSSSNMYYHGGNVEPKAKVFVVYWGSQWGQANGGGYPSNDASGEAPLQASLFKSMGGSTDTWSSTTTQYCENEPTGLYGCSTGATAVTMPGTDVLGGTWLDNATAAPKRPSQSQIASEAASAATHFGITDQADDQVVVDTASGDSETGFGTRWCAWHSSTSYNGGPLAYTYMPYITDAGTSCGANFLTSTLVNPQTEGVTIVGGHEYAETVTDAYPGSVVAWEDSGGSEIGDKCAWSSYSAVVSIGGNEFAMQPLWSNNYTAGGGSVGSTGGACVISYSSSTNQAQ
jgi:hypothetical protein